MELDGYSDARIVREAQYFEVMGSKDGKIGRISVDSRTGRFHANDDD